MFDLATIEVTVTGGTFRWPGLDGRLGQLPLADHHYRGWTLLGIDALAIRFANRRPDKLASETGRANSVFGHNGGRLRTRTKYGPRFV